MQPEQFGKRGVTLDGRPLDPEARSPVAIGPGVGRPGARQRLFGLVVIGLLFAVWLEALFAATALITPINMAFLWFMRGLGAILGLALAIFTIGTEKTRNSWRKALFFLVLPLLVGVLFDSIAWRMADWAAFGLSRQTFQPARYPVKWVSNGRKGRRDTIEIDPFDTGENTNIPIPHAQYYEWLGETDGQCVTVMQRTNTAGAIEILTDGQYTLHEPETATIGPCTGVESRPVSPSNPWSKQ
jgi:hypothetical protein